MDGRGHTGSIDHPLIPDAALVRCHLPPDVSGDLITSLHRRRPTQREEQREPAIRERERQIYQRRHVYTSSAIRWILPGEHALRKVALVDADVHITIERRIEKSSQTVDDSILRDLKLDAGVAPVVDFLVLVRVNKCEHLLRLAELVDVVHLDHVRCLEVCQIAAPKSVILNTKFIVFNAKFNIF